MWTADGKASEAATAALVACVLSSATLGAQTRTLRADQDVHGRKAWVLETDRIHMAFLQNGGHMAEISLISSNPRLSINPMFIPAGNGYMGHMVCFPNVGPASPEERQNGIGEHGEANGVNWEQTRPPQIAAQGITFFYGADLPKTQYRIERAVAVKSGETTIHVEEWIENMTPYDRPHNYDQHPTFGAPFVAPQRTVLDMSGTKGMTDPRRTAANQWAPAREFQWPNASRFTMPMTRCSFPTVDHPWIIDWQNRPQADSPAGTARAVLFGTSPFDEGQRKSVERGQLFGTPSYKFIADRQRLSTTYTIVLAEIPSGFAGVQDVRMDQSTIAITERGTGRQFTAR